ncbi:MAG: Gfo/Idh/MocA family oxidoreductase, partial [Candidatus Hydrogenedentales bacterium]
PQAKLVELADAFPDYLEAAYTKLKESPEGERVTVDEDHRFVGFDGYKGVIDSCDVILLCEPPNFRAKHLRAAVDAGKHVFAEKPIAVDGAGVRSVMETCRLAREKKLNIVSGLCYRYQFAKQDVVKRVHDGAVGDIVVLETKYNTGGLWHRGSSPDWSEMEYQIRNWIYFNWLSGDHINEQHIHSLDKIAWAMNEYPVKATASGGRVVRTDEKYGNVYDHFNTTYEWANGVRGFSSCRQWEGADTDVSDHVYGTKGVAHIQTHAIEPRGGSAWRHEESGPDDMYQNEHDALFRAIRNGETIVDEYMCDSTLMAIMGRESAYTGRTVTREEILNSDVQLGPENPEWGPSPVAPVPSPGRQES